MEYSNNPLISVGTRRIRTITRLSLWLSGIGIVVLFAFGIYTRLDHDDLRQFVPVHAQVYIHARNSLLPYSQHSISQLPIHNLLRNFELRLEVQEKSLEQELLPISSEVAFFAIPNLTDHTQREIGILFEVQQEHFDYRSLGLMEIVPGYYLLTDSLDLQLFVLQTVSGQLFSFKHELPRKQLVAYFDRTIFKTTESLIFSGAHKKNAWVVQTPSISQAMDTTDSILKYLDSAVYLQGMSYQSLHEQLSAHIPELVDVLSDITTEYPQLTGDFLSFALVSTQSDPTTFAISLAQSEVTNLSDLEQMITLFLAQRFPVTKQRELPDGTTVLETIIDPNSVEWQTNGLARIATVGQEYLELGYITKDNEIIISNSSKILAQLVRLTNPDASYGNCQLATNQYVAINLPLASDVLPLAQFLDSQWLIIQARGHKADICLSN